MPVPEAPLERTDSGLVPKGAGWFVVNAREARWYDNRDFGQFTRFEGDDDARFGQLGINIGIIQPGQPSCMYHRENAQEDFLVLYGECLLLVEEEERRLQTWDFAHCPPGTNHVFVGAGDGPCAILAVGFRPAEEELVYPASELAQRHRAGAEKDTPDPDEAYAPYSRSTETSYQDGWLP